MSDQPTQADASFRRGDWVTAVALRTLADSLHGPMPMHAIADLYRIVASDALDADPVVYTDARVAEQADRLCAALRDKLSAADVIRNRHGKPSSRPARRTRWRRRRPG